MNLRISTIIPVYNASKHLNRCVDSLINAQVKGFATEIILVNDGSNDNSLEICKAYEAKYANIRVLSQENKGPSSARNLGIKESKGEWISFVDSDDWVEQKYYNVLQETLNVANSDMIVFNMTSIYAGNIRKTGAMHSGKISAMRENYLCEDDIFYEGVFLPKNSPWDKIFKREIIMINEISFNEKLRNGEDYIFVLEYSFACKNIIFVNESLYFYNRINENSLTTQYNKNYYDDIKNMKDAHFDIIGRYRTISEGEKQLHYFRAAVKAVFEESKLFSNYGFKMRHKKIKSITNKKEISDFINLNNSGGGVKMDAKTFDIIAILMLKRQPLLLTIFLSILSKIK